MNACDILSAESNALLSLKLINLGKTLLTGEETKLYWFVTKPDTPNYACIPIKFFEMFIWYIRWTNPHSVAIRKQITNIRYHLITIHPIWTSSEKCFCHSKIYTHFVLCPVQVYLFLSRYLHVATVLVFRSYGSESEISFMPIVVCTNFVYIYSYVYVRSKDGNVLIEYSLQIR